MTVRQVVLMPGLDGTGKMFRPLLEGLSPDVAPKVVSYSPKVVCGYEGLEEHVLGALPAAGPFVIVAESFSGPLALRIACREPRGLAGLVLVATFIRSPLFGLLSGARWLAVPGLFRLPLPAFAVRHWLAGEDADDALVRAVAENVREVDPAVMAARVRAVIEVDAAAELERCRAPLLYLRGGRDRLVPIRAGDELRRVRPDLECVTLDAPHLVLQVRPVESARIVERFCARTGC